MHTRCIRDHCRNSGRHFWWDTFWWSRNLKRINTWCCVIKMLENGAFNVSRINMCFWKISISKGTILFVGHLQLVKVFFGMFVIDVCHLHPPKNTKTNSESPLENRPFAPKRKWQKVFQVYQVSGAEMFHKSHGNLLRPVVMSMDTVHLQMFFGWAGIGSLCFIPKVHGSFVLQETSLGLDIWRKICVYIYSVSLYIYKKYMFSMFHIYTLYLYQML